MHAVEKALWYIESHFAQDITLDAIARVGGLSRHHMSRAFGMTTGLSLKTYLRARRLSEAARALAAGATDILSVALEAGYGSHEAFTRAFRDLFGVTPEAVRAQGNVDNLQLQEPIKITDSTSAQLTPPRLVEHSPILIAGLCERMRCDNAASIPALWQRFAPYIGHVSDQIGERIAYGVRNNFDEEGNFEYMCGVEVAHYDRVPSELQHIQLPAQRYAVFTHHGHIAAIRATHHAIWSQWLPSSGYRIGEGADFERYDERFNPDTGLGEVEIWVPIGH